MKKIIIVCSLLFVAMTTQSHGFVDKELDFQRPSNEITQGYDNTNACKKSIKHPEGHKIPLSNTGAGHLETEFCKKDEEVKLANLAAIVEAFQFLVEME